MTTTVQNLDNSDAAVEMFEQTVEGRRERERDETLSRQEARAAKRRLEQKREHDREAVQVPLDGETIAMQPLDEGKALQVARRAIKAERTNSRQELIVAMDEMRQTCADRAVHGDVLDRAFWDQFHRDELRDFWQEWGLKSRGGDAAGNS